MTAAAAPWHERHKGKIIGWGLLVGLVGILGVAFRADIRPHLAAAGRWPGSLVAVIWEWLWTSHGVYGWAILVLAAVAVCGGLFLVVALLAQRPVMGAKAFTLIMGGVQWRGQITQSGTVVGTPVPYCPHCQCQILPVQGWNYHGGGYFTQLHCEDCGRTNQTEPGSAKHAYNRASRRVEAKWHRGELKLDGDQ